METPITDLNALLAQMQPTEGPVCAFCQLSPAAYDRLEEMPLAMFAEAEGVTVVYPLEIAERLQLPIRWVGVQITLQVHSSLDAVGFLACVTQALAANGISTNAFSPIAHDHIFVKPSDVERALATLRALSASSIV